MYQDRTVLCGSSKYTRKFYLNEDFNGLPQGIQDDLKILCVIFTEEVGGTIQLVFDEEGHLSIETDAEEEDILYDEIGAALKVKKYQIERRELFESLEMYYKVFCLGMAFEEA